MNECRQGTFEEGREGGVGVVDNDSWAVCTDGSGDEKGGSGNGKVWKEK